MIINEKFKFKKKFKSYDEDFLNDNYYPLDLNLFKEGMCDDLEELKKNRSKLKYD
ncbi:MAG: hypothetical protein ACR2HS_03325 [Gammaproteobacteria bacterium]